MDRAKLPQSPAGERNRQWSRRDFLRHGGQLTAAGLVAGSGLAMIACEKKPPGQKKTRRIHLLQWSNFIAEADEEVRRQTEEFQSQTGVNVNLEFINANDLPARSTSAVESGQGPDIIQFQWNQPHLYQDGLIDVDDLAQEIAEQQGGYYDVAVAAAKVGDHFKAVPYHIVGNAIVYRKDIFDELGLDGIPDNWEDFMAMARTLKENGTPVGQSFGHTFGDAPTWCYPMLWSWGGQEVDAAGNVVINSPETVRSIEYNTELYRQGMDEGGLSWDDTSNNRAFFAETIAATLNGASIYFVAKRNPDKYPGLAEKLRHGLLPAGPNGRYHSLLNFQHGIMKYSEQPEAAKDFIRYLMQPENFEKWFVISNGYSLGTTRQWEDHEMWEQNPAITIFRDMARYGRTFGHAGPYDRQASEVKEKYIIVDLYARVLQGTDTAEDAAAWAAGELESVYGRA